MATASPAPGELNRKKTSFFDIARELRDQMYENVSESMRLSIIDSKICPYAQLELQNTPSLALKLVNHQVKQEYEEAIARAPSRPRLRLELVWCPPRYQGLDPCESFEHLPLKLRKLLAEIQELKIEYTILCSTPCLKALTCELPSLKKVRHIHHDHPYNPIEVIDGELETRWPGVLNYFDTNQEWREDAIRLSDKYTTERDYVLHDRLFSMWDQGVPGLSNRFDQWNFHGMNTMTYAVKRIGRSYVVRERRPYHRGSTYVRSFVDLYFEPLPAFAGNFDEVEADLAKKCRVMELDDSET